MMYIRKFHFQNLTFQIILFLYFDFVEQPSKDQLIMKNKYLRTIRERFNYSQEYVAGRLGISQSNYIRIENGGIKLDIERLTQLAQLYQLEPHALLVCDEQNEKICQRINECYPGSKIPANYNSNMICIKRIEYLEKKIGL